MSMLKDTISASVDKRPLKSYFTTAADRRYVLRLALTLLAITMLSALLLGLTHYETEPIIRKRTEEKTQKAMGSVLYADYYRDVMDFEPVKGVTSVKQAVVGGRSGGYVCQVESSGFGGTMSLVVGVDEDGLVTGVAVINHGETKNIGTKVVENEEVLADFAGLAGPIAATGGDEGFDAVSGATYSSEGVLNAVNAALAVVAELEGKG